jgi:hypothetical protein
VKRVSITLLSAAALYLIAGNLLDFVIFPEEELAARFYPRAGFQFTRWVLFAAGYEPPSV